MLNRLDRWLGWLEWILYLGAATALALMMITISADTLGRYLFSRPISGVYEINEMYLLTAVVFLSIARAQRFNRHIAVHSIYEVLGDGLQRLTRIVGRLLSVSLFCALAFKSGEMALAQFVMGNMTSGALALPTWVSWFFVWIGASAMTLRILLQLTFDILNKNHTVKYTPD